MSAKTILKKSSLTFLEHYLNNASPTGYESEGQKMWMDYIKPFGLRLFLQCATIVWLVGCAVYSIKVIWG